MFCGLSFVVYKDFYYRPAEQVDMGYIQVTLSVGRSVGQSGIDFAAYFYHNFIETPLFEWSKIGLPLDVSMNDPVYPTMIICAC